MILDTSKLANLLSKGYALISDTVYLPRYAKTKFVLKMVIPGGASQWQWGVSFR